MKKEPFWKPICAKTITLKLPNPIWWIVGYGVIYPYKQLAKLVSKPTPRTNHCDGCGKDIGESLWGFCSVECIEIIDDRKNKPWNRQTKPAS